MREICSNSKILSKPKSNKRCRRNKEIKTPVYSTGPSNNDFLRQSFGPINSLGNEGTPEAIRITAQFEKSLKYILALYKLPFAKPCETTFPLNIHLAFNQTKELLGELRAELDLLIFQNNKGEIVLGTMEELNTKWTLYYVPLKPLWILHHRKEKISFSILLAIYQFLYVKAGMPKFHSGNYTFDTCEIIQEQVQENESDFTTDELAEINLDLKCIIRITPVLNRSISSLDMFIQLPELLDGFYPANKFESDLKTIAQKLIILDNTYPNDFFTQNMSGPILFPSKEIQSDADQYFSFCWSTNGWLMEQIEHFVNTDLQELTHLNAPCSIQLFNRRHKTETHGLKYQKALLLLLDDLSELLTNSL